MSSRILQRLTAQGVVSVEDMEAAQVAAEESGVPLIRYLVDRGVVSEVDLFMVAAEVAGMPFIDPGALMVDPEASRFLPASQARNLQALPFAWHEGALLVAVSDATNISLKDDLTRMTGAHITFCLAPPRALSEKIGQVYRSDAEIGMLSNEIISDMSGAKLENEIAEIEAASDADAPVIRFVDVLITQAVNDRASDIHIEPGPANVLLRYRIDGVLQDQSTVPRSILNGIVSRLKVMGGMDIAERRAPQDGRTTVLVEGRKVDLRMSVLPTVWGEKVVLRILDQATGLLDLGKLGMSTYNLERYRAQYSQPNGLILVTGPTGSGKSTTLYSTINEVKSPQINVITVEDPVEFRLAGISQIQIARKAGVTFASALRSILRADPDVVLVGEIRDRETAQIAIEAALTGHLVLTSMHTNDAPSVATRLIEMGVEPFLVGAATRCAVAQRLLRRLCGKCREPYVLSEEELHTLSIEWNPDDGEPVVYRPQGCPHCGGTGYKGRVPLHEVMVVDSSIERLINENGHTDKIREVSIADGMRPMRHDGWAKAFAGITSIEEVLRILG